MDFCHVLSVQILAKRGVDYLLCHGPKVHQELWGMSCRDATLHFIRESCRLEDVPVTFYRLQKVRVESEIFLHLNT